MAVEAPAQKTHRRIPQSPIPHSRNSSLPNSVGSCIPTRRDSVRTQLPSARSSHQYFTEPDGGCTQSESI